jgi:hypothetical protein
MRLLCTYGMTTLEEENRFGHAKEALERRCAYQPLMRVAEY